MPIAPISSRLSVASSKPVDVNALANRLWELVVQIPEGPIRENFGTIRFLSTQMDDAIRAVLGAPQGQCAQLLALMQAFTGTAVTEAQMLDPTELKKENPHSSFAIGKVSLFFHQALAAKPTPAVDAYIAKQPAPSGASQAAEASKTILPSALHSPSFERAALPPQSLTSFSRSPSLVPLPLRVSAPRVAARPFESQSTSESKTRSPQMLGSAQLSSAAALVVGPRALPDALKQCLATFDSNTFGDVTDAVACFVCPETRKVWWNPVIDLRDGQSYEAAHLPAGVARQHIHRNEAVIKFVRVWRNNMQEPAACFAARLEQAVPRDQFGNVIYDPVMDGKGRTYSAQALAQGYRDGTIEPELAATLQQGDFCINRLLVVMMQHFDIGALSGPIDVLARRASQLSLRPESVFGDDAVEELFEQDKLLQQTRAVYESTMVGAHSEDYDEAFHAGLDINTIMNVITPRMQAELWDAESVQLMSLYVMRSDCYRIKQEYVKAAADLVTAAKIFIPGAAEFARAALLTEKLSITSASQVIPMLLAKGFTDRQQKALFNLASKRPRNDHLKLELQEFAKSAQANNALRWQ